MHVCPECGESADEPGECAQDSTQRLDNSGDEHLGLQIGPYRIARLLGAGGMGRVYLGVHPEIGSRVAIKIFSRDLNAHSDLVERFFAEARATNLIRHENIINVLDVDRLESGRPYMVMEHLRGLPLSKLIGTPMLTDSGTISIMLDVLAGLAAAHGHQIIHRDLKPDNIFVSPEGHATLLDFGVAKLVPEMMGEAATTTGAILGTPHYMSPEQAVGDAIDLRTDLYALGIILYECFTGKRPFNATSLYKLLDLHVNKVPETPRSIRADISEEISALVMRAISKAPEQRFQSAASMRDALQDCETGSTSQSLRIRINREEEVAHRISPSPSEHARAEDKTAATKVDNPQKRSAEAPTTIHTRRPDSTAASTSGPRYGLWLASGGFALTAVIALFVGIGIGSGGAGASIDASLRSDSLDSAEYPVGARDGGAVRLAARDASPLDAAGSLDATPSEADLLRDAAVLVDARAGKRATPSKRKPIGVAPLSLLKIATRASRAIAHDAVLESIHLSGVRRNGRIVLSEKKSGVYMSFYSSELAKKTRTVTKQKPCRIQVRFESSTTPKVLRNWADCDAIRTVSPPPCSLARVLDAASKQGLKLGSGETVSAIYHSVGRLAGTTPSWSLSAPDRRRFRTRCGP